MFSKLLLYFNTIRFLRPIQILHRIIRLRPRLRRPLSVIPKLRKVTAPMPVGLPKRASMTGQRKFNFQNFEVTVSQNSNWETLGNSALWRYNLHYFDDFLASTHPQRTIWQDDFLQLWLETQAFGSNISWDAYPTSQRIVNWIKSHHFRKPLYDKAICSLANQTYWLEKHFEWHLMGNHLFVNAKALTWAGCFFEGQMAEKWLRLGTRLLSKEIDEQILSDGGHFELSPMYHSLVLEDILDLIALSHAYDLPQMRELRPKLLKTAQKMVKWLTVMTHPDGEISFLMMRRLESLTMSSY